MIRTITARMFGLIVLLAALAGWSVASALELEEAKTRGLVGERPDGYLGIVIDNPPPEVSDLVREINRKRREKYEEIAARNDTSVTVVQQLAGKKAIEKTSGGMFVQVPEGTWIRK